VSDSIKRREFIKAASLLGASATILSQTSAKSDPPQKEVDSIMNSFFKVSFDKKKGTLSILKRDGTPLFTAGTVCVNLSGDQILKISISSPNYGHSLATNDINDQLGHGKRLVIFSKDKKKILDFEIRVSLYEQSKFITIEAICKNASKHDLVIHSLEPIRVIQAEGGFLHVPEVSKCLTNGEMYFDAGTIHEFGNRGNAITSGELKGVKLANGRISPDAETIHSWWNAGFFSGYDKEGLVLGYLENNSCLGNFLIAKTGSDQISFLAESVYPPALTLKPGKTIRSNRVMINLAEGPFTALESYAEAIGKFNNARARSVVNGWCSWFYTLAQVSEKEVVRNTEFAATHLKALGLQYIQVDEGYQRWHGDWEGNDRFPNGMKWLADQIKLHGFKAGIWISPYVISEPTEVFQKHKDWLVKTKDGSPQRVGVWDENTDPPADENPKRYCLDITHPEAANWLHHLVDTIVNKWGYEMIKIDFVAWSILAANRYHDPSFSSAEVYRKGMEIMRRAAGERCHILECGPGNITTGLIDSMRIEADVNYGYSDAAWDTYFIHPAGSASAAAKRYYFHKRTWVNDADHLCMDLLTNQQSEAAATLIALSGGNMMSGDRLIQLDPYKLEILRKITPSFGEAAFPVDLFDGENQSVFALKIKKPFADWTIIGFFNASPTEIIAKKFPLERFGLKADKTYLAFDFWKQQFVGEVSRELRVNLQPGSVTLLSLHEKTGKPQFISTGRHVLQGAIEIENVKWDESAKTISGLSWGPLGGSYNVYVYVPEEHPWTWGGSALYRDYDLYNLKLVDKNIIRVNLHFGENEKVKWEIKSGEFVK